MTRAATSTSAIGADGAAGGQFPAPADGWDIFPAAGFTIAGQETPGLAVFFEQRFAAVVGIEAQALAGSDGFDGDDIPEFFGDDVGGDEVDVVGGVGIAPSGGFDAVAVISTAFSGFDLNAPESASGADQKVLGMGFSPGTGDIEVEKGDGSEECGLDGFTEALARSMSDERLTTTRRTGRFVLAWSHKIRKAQLVGCAWSPLNRNYE